ncbi:transposase IS116/IS110/IS902 family protein [Thermoanaerobacter italicus Ab9]|uniref:Transposase IS116/IS110/IS902 family protein n=1 Tax=Thermoanaerobacter italicus (strain DSM 9252 / Ab9) TaxID=580331 RepID=D3T4H2_THEIA|nr:IS110 family transposase [Thermoanaerobacter italicus]ADD03124.1 transposase IS116/IS110/IS902 family protein [Thermoanaerobacter italicus Ab9]
MPNTLIVGIDISSQSNSIFFIDDAGNHLIKKPFYLPNDQEGANELVNKIIDCLNQFNLSSVKVGMESTSHYAWHLHLYLASSSELLPYKPTFFVLNPSTGKGFKKIYTFLPKTDNIDAIIIAEYVRFSKLNPTPLPDFKYAALQRLTRMRYYLVHNLSREKNRALNLIYLKFSSYSKNCPFSNIFGKASLAIIENFTPDDIASMPLEDLINFISDNGNNRLSDVNKIAEELKTAANRAFRLHSSLTETNDLALSMTLENIRFMQQQLKKLDKEISKLLNAFSQTLNTIPGIGDVLAAGIIAEIGDINRFKNEAALAKYAGLVWTQYQSGNFNAQETSLAKCGNQYLRYYLVEAANCVRVHTVRYKAFYSKKYSEVTKHQHKRALVLTARRLIPLIFTMLSKGQIYQERGDVYNT